MSLNIRVDLKTEDLLRLSEIQQQAARQARIEKDITTRVARRNKRIIEQAIRASAQQSDRTVESLEIRRRLEEPAAILAPSIKPDFYVIKYVFFEDDPDEFPGFTSDDIEMRVWIQNPLNSEFMGPVGLLDRSGGGEDPNDPVKVNDQILLEWAGDSTSYAPEYVYLNSAVFWSTYGQSQDILLRLEGGWFHPGLTSLAVKIKVEAYKGGAMERQYDSFFGGIGRYWINPTATSFYGEILSRETSLIQSKIEYSPGNPSGSGWDQAGYLLISGTQGTVTYLPPST